MTMQDLRTSMLSHLKLHFNNHDRNDESVLGACECGDAAAARLAAGARTTHSNP